MSDAPVFFHLRSKTLHPCYATKDSRAEALRTWLCPGCASPKPGVKGIDVWLQERAPRDKPLNLVFGCGIGLIHKELLNLVGHEIVERDLYIGRVMGDRGNEIADWVTFRGRCGVIVRGSKDAANRVCQDCGRNVYFAIGKRYLYPAPPAAATVFQSYHGLVVPPAVQERVAARKWRMLRMEELPVLEQPTDGLGVLSFN
jgi:hypothetical protein